MRLRVADGEELGLLSAVTTFGTPLDATVAGLSMESFFPADTATAARLQHRASTNDERIHRLGARHPHLAHLLVDGA